MFVTTNILNEGTDIPDRAGPHGYRGGVGRRTRTTPAETVNDWPDQPSGEPIAEANRRFVLNLRDAIGDRSLRTIEEATGVNYTTVHAILAGRTWPDTLTVARLEHGLGVALWPGPVAT